MGQRCYCDSQKEFESCCGPLLVGQSSAQTSEQLMRSRFSAFCRKDLSYLVDTLHISRRALVTRVELQKTFDSLQWKSLRVISSSARSVEFVAFYLDERKQVQQLHEVSEFILEDGYWYYLQGDIKPPITLGRNDLCWCGSGKKLKKCHPK